MARALGWDEVAPFYIDLESPVPASGIPKPGPLEVHLKDDHMQYAITWFGLAGAVVIAFGVWWRGAAAAIGVRRGRMRRVRKRGKNGLSRHARSWQFMDSTRHLIVRKSA